MRNTFLVLSLVLIGFVVFVGFVLASSTNGTIDSTDRYAWSENTGWLDFGAAEGNVKVTDSGLTGYAWGENIGWISLNCSNDSSCSTVDYSVVNDGAGSLSGYAYGENIGWVNFNPTYGGVTVNTSGEFLGYAYGENTGWIIFNCATTESCATVDYKVKTDWRPQSARPACNNSSDDDGDGLTDYPNDPGCDSLIDTDEIDPISGGAPGSFSGGASVPEAKYQIIHPDGTITYVEEVVEIERTGLVEKIVEKSSDILKSFVPSFFKPKPKQPSEIQPQELPQEAPLVMKNKWSLLSRKSVEKFVLAPLPKEFRILAQKFPKLKKTFEQIGITKITDIEKLKTAKLTLPRLEESEEIPTEIVFAKTGKQLIDFNIALSVTEKGRLQQKITTISGKPLQLTVRPDNPVKSIKGYVVFRSKTQAGLFQMPFSSLSASLFFAKPVLAQQQEKPIRVEEKLVLLEFEYTDPDGDGVYTAEIQTPLIEGEYEIITVLEFEDSELGKKEIRLITVVDPEGYIYAQLSEGKLRVTGAIVSIYWLNSKISQYELWLAKEYQQENPQITNDTGKYSFLVPPGMYYLKVEHPNYPVYQSDPFAVEEGAGVHMNIELKKKFWWLEKIDWKITIMIIFGILLLYNFYNDKIRDKFLKRRLK